MSWKNWPSWLKGGVIGGVIGLLIWIFGFMAETGEIFGVFGRFLKDYFDLRFLSSLPCYIIGDGWCWLFIGHILDIIIGFVIGALIGGVISKIRRT